MKLYFRRLCGAVLLILALQPIYLISLVATDYVAPPDLRLERLKRLPEAPNDTAECVSLAIGLQPNGAGLHNAIMEARPVAGNPCESLPIAVATPSAVSWLPYPRYWHGYRVVIDPLTAYLPIMLVRYLFLAALIAAIAWFALELRPLVPRDAVLALIVSTVVLTDLSRVWFFTAQTLAIVVIFAGAAVVARKARRLDSNLILVAAVFGSFFNFVDNLVNPPWQPMLIAFVALAAGRSLSETLLVLVGWSLGYSLTWASKWAIACAAGVQWRDIFDVILYRMNGDEQGFVVHRFLAPSGKVLTYFYQQIQSSVTFLLLLPLLVFPMRWPNPKQFLVLSSPILIPFAWFELLSNHSQIHYWLVYRPIASCFGILIAAGIITSREPVPRG